MNAIGIDLGTTNCCMAVVKNGRPEIITTLDGRTTPSYVSFTDDEMLIGNISKDRLPKNPTNTIYDVKRFIGLQLSSKPVQDGLNKWGFQLVNIEGKLKVFIKTKSTNKFYSPEEISAIILQNMKQCAEKYIDAPVSKAVITVPTYFNDAQRQATIDAGRIAGFEEISLLNEPTAAAIAYVTENNITDERKVAVFDFGGGTFDISIVQISNNNIDVLAIDGDLCLGGNDVDDILFEYVVKYINQRYKYNIKQDKLKVYRLRQKCEAMKKQLGTCEEAYIDGCDFVPNIDEDFEIILSRAEFDKLCDNVYEKNSAILDNCLKRAHLNKSDIKDIVMVGGSTKIPSVNTLLRDYFNIEPKHSINPDEAVAIGAAIHASKWTSEIRYKDLVLIDITPYSLGVETIGGEMNVIIPKFSKLPIKNKKIFCTTKDMQKTISVKIYAGEDIYTKNNDYLGCVEVAGFVRGPKGSVKLEETFAIDENGILTVTVLDITTQKSIDLQISLDKGRLTDQEIMKGKSEVIHEFCKMLDMKKLKKMKNDLVKMCRNPLIVEEHDTNAICDWLQNASIENLEEVQQLHDELSELIVEAGKYP